MTSMATMASSEGLLGIISKRLPEMISEVIPEATIHYQAPNTPPFFYINEVKGDTIKSKAIEMRRYALTITYEDLRYNGHGEYVLEQQMRKFVHDTINPHLHGEQHVVFGPGVTHIPEGQCETIVFTFDMGYEVLTRQENELNVYSWKSEPVWKSDPELDKEQKQEIDKPKTTIEYDKDHKLAYERAMLGIKEQGARLS